MKHLSKFLKICLTCPILLLSIIAYSQDSFYKWFENRALRIDYSLAGNSNSQQFFLDEIRIEPHWSGSFLNPIDKLNLGTHRVEVFDKNTQELIYSHGFCTLFQEWQTVNEAAYLHRTFEQVTRIPLPHNEVKVSFLSRDKKGEFVEFYRFDLDPHSLFVNRHPIVSIPSIKIVDNGNPNEKLDFVFIAEGYTAKQMPKFISDVENFSSYLFNQKPFDELADDINIWAVKSASLHEGPTNPSADVWNNTATYSSFFTFGIDRYLTTTKFKRVMDIAANVPGDIVFILVNSSEYGGGGIYNHYNVGTSDNQLSEVVFIHEIGHGLAGLGDEYFTSDVAYQNFYPLHIEPWELNITTLVDFKSKWKSFVNPSTPIPTPLDDDYSQVIGVFEGAGYSPKGIFRPYSDCRMKSNEAEAFCPVCQDIIRRVVRTYTNQP